MSRSKIASAVVLAASLTLAACGDSASEADPASADSSENASETASESTSNAEADVDAEAITMEEPVVRAMESGKGMTGVFGTLTNSTDQDINIVDFSTDLGEETNELHEVVDGVMQEKPGGFVVPANGTYELAPGADHFMIMGFDEAIEAGDVVNVTIEDSDGNTYEVNDVAVRTLIPGEEDYGEDGELEGHNHEMDHSGH